MRRRREDLAGASAVLYARRSKPDPRNPGKSTADQLDTQRDRANLLTLTVIAEFTDDGIGASRHSSSKIRPGFVAAVEYLRDHPVEVFALWELSRATRRLRVYSELMELCEDRGTYLLVGDRIYDPLDPTDQMVLGMTAVQDSAEVARLRERTLRGVASTAAAGRPHGRQIYGYERIYDPRTRALVEVREHPEQGAVIRELVSRTLGGESGHQITRELNIRRIPKPTGAAWHPSDVREMLSRPTYRGMRGHRGRSIEGIWPALISPDQWSELQRVFAGRSRGIHDTTAKHLLTGIAMCRLCHRPMYVDIKRARYVQTYYHCHGCSRSRNAAHLEAWVRDAANGFLGNPMARAAMASKPPATQGTELLLTALRTELDEAYTLGLSPRGLATIEQRLLPQIEQLELQLDATRPGPDLTRFTEVPADIELARLLLRSLFRVWISASRRGRGFDPTSVDIRLVTLGPPADRS